MKTPWGLISATYDLWTPEGQGQGRKLLARAGARAGGAASRRLQQSPAVPANGAAAPGLSLPSNSSIPADYDVDQTKLGEALVLCLGRAQGALGAACGAGLTAGAGPERCWSAR